MKATVLIAAIALSLAACSREDAGERFRSTDYYRQHAVEREEMIRRCEHGVDGYQERHPENCGTAQAARAMEERAADAARRTR